MLKPDSMEIAVAERVGKHYQRGDVCVEALQSVSFSLRQGEFLIITGESGSGKSTLLNLCGALDVPDTGVLRLFGQDVGTLSDSELSRLRKEKIGFIFQDFHLIPVLTAQENVRYALDIRHSTNAGKKAQALLASVGLADKCQALVTELSGGQMQRVAIARALAGSPALIVADEPTANLDSKNKVIVMTLLKNLCRERNVAVVLVTHDRSLVSWADRVLVMQDGKECGKDE
ncbi:ABC transporter ATP-binding protein [Klebsiella aerogenes]|uniref:ABC transporter ATP-binding protein n=1 Tax=Klebsiella aerogenes TaxID=548 RepID=UPI00069E4629|nr:ABC transporter ATP-binding protein [Klebsiella aerogenes]EKZ5786608.1 ABC transporter ATP-binding protein [Klebsiella aerogenes]MEB5740873.1 ABC transporter ATP-binding protein [Klebsiella aerogenes]RSV84367.1 ABC transporter ATP-binding protein [Klebsiella aerogenes]RSW10185.1 ABC transporter ATP-binding protein [Klebsiella aerogenes]HBV6369705.1 ABC transporter ATP-binding protein [Klebsiella aerogenes]